MADIVTSITLDDSGYQAAAQRVVGANQRMVAATANVAETQRQIVPATRSNATRHARRSGSTASPRPLRASSPWRTEIVMPDNSLMIIHRPYALVLGNAADMQAMVEALNRVEDSMVLAYKRSRQTDVRIKALLAAETWMSAQEAFDFGFADRVADPVAIAAHFDLSKFGYRHPPGRARPPPGIG